MENFYKEQTDYLKLLKELEALDISLASDLIYVIGKAIQYGIDCVEKKLRKVNV